MPISWKNNMNLFQYLERKKKKREQFEESEDYSFYQKNKGLLNKLPQFSYLTNKKETDFRIMRANVIIHGLINKQIIESEVKNLVKYTENHEILTHEQFVDTLKKRIVTRPYLDSAEGKIYIPFFSKSINMMYLNEPEKLNEYPYTELIKTFSSMAVDPFDTFGAELYNSHFTRLVKISTYKEVTAFFHYDTFTIYLINNQGRLDAKIVLFDKYLKKIYKNHMLERVRPVVDAYFSNNKQEFIKELHENTLISSKMFFKLTHKFGK